MDTKRVESRGTTRHQQSSESPPTRRSSSPSPHSYSTSVTANETNYGNYNNGEKKNKIIDGGSGGNVSLRSNSPLSPLSESHRSNNRYTRGEDSPVDKRSNTRRRRSRSRSSSTRSHKRSRSRDRDKERCESNKERSRKYSRRDRQSSRSRSRSRSKDRRRSRSRNKSRDKYRYRDGRRYNRQNSYESDAAAAHDDINETMASKSMIIAQPNAFKNDGSFMEMFKKMQEQMQPTTQQQTATSFSSSSSSSASASASASNVLQEKTNPPPPLMVGKRRGGRILKTGMVAKPKNEAATADQPKDAWSLYMAEVKKYREVCCQEEDNTRPLLYYHSTMTGVITEDQLRTAPDDPRFPNQNQTKHCWSSYVDFHRCKKVRGEEFDACQYYKRAFTSLCPHAWVEKWNDQVEAGTFPGRI